MINECVGESLGRREDCPSSRTNPTLSINGEEDDELYATFSEAALTAIYALRWIEKRPHVRDPYAKHGVQTYLIVDPDTKSIEHLSLEQGGNYESVDASTRLEVTVCGDCAIAVDLVSLFRG